jgi:pyruvate,orthophosphate dikinase
MKEMLGGKGANLAEMTSHRPARAPRLHDHDRRPARSTTRPGASCPTGCRLMDEVKKNLSRLEKETGKKFGDRQPAAVSVRSGAAVSMPGMMDTVLNLGLNDETVAGLAKATGNERFAYDATAASSTCSATS